MVQRFDDRVPGDFKPAAQIIPDRDAELVTGLEETEESVAAVPSDVASRASADLSPRHVTANVVFRAVGAWFKAGLHGATGLTLPGRMMAP